jgi:hypothetical protein
MNWKLIFGLSLFGLAMAFATVFWIQSNIEPFFWVVIAIVCGYFIAMRAPGRYFLHGFLVSLVNCAWITGTHIMLSATYLARHAKEADQYAQMNKQAGLTVTQVMLIFGPIIGIISGVLFGLFAVIASKVVRKA